MFDFNAVTVASDQVFVSEYTFPGVTTSPLAILSRGDVTIDGKIDVSALNPPLFPRFLPPVAPAASAAVVVPGRRRGGSNGSGYATYFTSPGGGGFGGRGGNGSLGSLPSVICPIWRRARW